MAKTTTEVQSRPKVLDVLISIAEQALSFRYTERQPTMVDIGRIVIAASRVLHIRDLDERISCENSAVLAIAKQRNLIS